MLDEKLQQLLSPLVQTFVTGLDGRRQDSLYRSRKALKPTGRKTFCHTEKRRQEASTACRRVKQDTSGEGYLYIWLRRDLINVLKTHSCH